LKTSTQTHTNAILLTAFGVVLLSFDSVFIKFSNVSAFVYTFYLGLLMFLSINIILYSSKKSKFLNVYKNNPKAILLSSIFFATSNILFFLALRNTSVANTVLIVSSGAIFSSFYAYIFYRQKSGKNIFVSSFFIFIGLVVIFYGEVGTGNSLGNIYALMSVSLFSLAFVILARHKEVNKFAVAATSGLLSVIITSFFISTFILDTQSLIVLLIAGIIVSPSAKILIAKGTEKLSASEVSLLLVIETVVAPILVWIFFDEIPAGSTFLGGFIIISTIVLNSIYIIYMGKKKQ
jgi:drug/metabolite transporter (DMT)-like permease